nr:hypothetical protein [Paraburkholderia sp. BL8N3]
MEWMRWYAAAQRELARTEIGKALEIVTVFLSIAPKTKAAAVDELERGRRMPALFETTAFIMGGASFERIRLVRSRTWPEAEAAHGFIVEQIQEAATEGEQQVRSTVIGARDRWLARRVEGD